MGKEVTFKNRDRMIQIGISILTVRRLRGMSQEELAAKAGISRTYLAMIESPTAVHNFSLDVLFNIADALRVDPADLISTSVFPDKIIKNG